MRQTNYALSVYLCKVARNVATTDPDTENLGIYPHTTYSPRIPSVTNNTGAQPYSQEKTMMVTPSVPYNDSQEPITVTKVSAFEAAKERCRIS